jgi:uncharacterized protein (DUF305 family)
VRRAVILFLSVGFAATAAVGQTTAPPGKQGAAMTNAQQGGGAKESAPAASSDAFEDASVQMQRDLQVRYTDDADHDFASVMAAYHKGAIAAANIELKYGTDPQMRHLAETIIAANEKQIAQAQAWQKKHR